MVHEEDWHVPRRHSDSIKLRRVLEQRTQGDTRKEKNVAQVRIRRAARERESDEERRNMKLVLGQCARGNTHKKKRNWTRELDRSTRGRRHAS